MHSSLPKVLHRLGGRPLLGHVLTTARRLAPERIIVVYGHGGEALRAAFAAEPVRWVEQREQLGTGHALLQAAGELDDGSPTLVLYGDVPLIRGQTLSALANEASGGKLAVLTAELDDPSGYGRIVREGGTLVRIVEERDATPAERAIREINSGIMVAPTSALKRWLQHLRNDNRQKEYYLTDVVGFAVSDRIAVGSARPQDAVEILGVNSKAQLAALERVYQGRVASELLEAGVTLSDPARLDVRGELRCGRDVTIDVNCVFEGSVELRDGASVGAHCVLRDAVIGAGSRVEPFCHIDGAIVGADARVGPFARLRPQSRLADRVHVGNFVEVKASELGAGSKANHLAYVGDSTVGSNVNIGAGTITCNYDGANKHRTVIEDDAFIGSDCQLVAPVRVGRGATLGAGTTLTRDAPPDKLTLSRAPQRTLEGWKRPTKKT
jgi:bifunctional UDP-N-acetylglucosamine pyrophosphorylase/glucosamine-1-phosphate N-acetyltransferase